MTLTPENIDRTTLLTLLRTYNCCAGKKSVQYIEAFEKGNPSCAALFDDTELMFNLIDSIKCVIPKGTIISGDQACFLATPVVHLSPATVTIIIGSAIYPVAVLPSSAQSIAAYINSFYPQTFPYTASYVLDDLTICGTDYEASNGTSVFIHIQKGGSNQFFSGDLLGGTEKVLQGDNCITNEEIISIVNKLNALCAMPCNKIVNFE